jgi:hypothetical protein
MSCVRWSAYQTRDSSSFSHSEALELGLFGVELPLWMDSARIDTLSCRES